MADSTTLLKRLFSRTDSLGAFRFGLLFSLILCAAGLVKPASAGEEWTGRAIMEEQERRHDVDSEVNYWAMTLVDSRGRERDRSLVSFSKTLDSGVSRTLLKYLEPTDIKDVGLLTWEQPTGQEDDQWLYLPASRQIKRIAGGSKKNSFMGSDLAYEDFRSEDLDEHSYELIGEEALDGQACYVVEALPATEEEQRDSGYSKRVFWIRKDIFLTVQTEFYNRRDRLSKVAKYTDLKQVSDTAWRVDLVVMETLKAETRTLMRTTKRAINEPIDESLFATQMLKRPLVLD